MWLSPVVGNLFQDYHDYGYVSLNDYRLRRQITGLKQETRVGVYRYGLPQSFEHGEP